MIHKERTVQRRARAHRADAADGFVDHRYLGRKRIALRDARAKTGSRTSSSICSSRAPRKRTAAQIAEADRRGRRRAQRVHRQGVHLLLRQGARRRPADDDRAARRPLPGVGVRPGRNRSRAPGRAAGNLAGRGHARRFHPRPVQSEVLGRPSAGAADFRLGRDRQRDQSRAAGLLHGRPLPRGPGLYRGGRAWSITSGWSHDCARLFGGVSGDGTLRADQPRRRTAPWS